MLRPALCRACRERKEGKACDKEERCELYLGQKKVIKHAGKGNDYKKNR